MRIGLLAALTLLLTTAGLALGENANAASRESIGEENFPLGDLSDKALTHGDVKAEAETFGFWVSAEYLLWWIKNGQVPPLVTAGGNGVIGSPGTRVLLDDLNFVDDFRQGGRFALGYRFESNPPVSIEASYFFLSDAQEDARQSRRRHQDRRAVQRGALCSALRWQQGQAPG